MPYDRNEAFGIEFVITLNYSRTSPLLGAAQPTMVNAFVALLQEQGTEVQVLPQICISKHTNVYGHSPTAQNVPAAPILVFCTHLQLYRLRTAPAHLSVCRW